MSISAAQCRAARALLDWSQEQLAKNAHVSRATIADFERNFREPIRNNMISIASALEAAGITFIGEDDEGAGVRFRKVEIEYNTNLKVLDIGLSMSIRYKGEPYQVVVPDEVLNDLDRTNYYTVEDKKKSFSEHLPVFLCAAEDSIKNGCISDHNFIVLIHEKLPLELF